MRLMPAGVLMLGFVTAACGGPRLRTLSTTEYWRQQKQASSRVAKPGATEDWVQVGSTVVLQDPHGRTAGDEVARAVFTKEPWERILRIPGLSVVTRQRGIGIVTVSPAGASHLAGLADTWTRVEAVPWNRVLMLEGGGVAAETPDPAVSRILDEVTEEKVGADIQHLVDFKTRYSTSAAYHDAAGWAAERMKSLGLTVERCPFDLDGHTSENVVGDLPATGSSTDLYIVGGHLDSISMTDVTSAPGADDNASGSASVLAVAAVLSRHRPAVGLRFILFGGEEEDLKGSAAYVAALPPKERARVKGVLTLDMTGFYSKPERGLMLEGLAISAELTAAVAKAAATYTTLKVDRTLEAWGSDHMSFLDVGIPALLTYELDYPTNGHQHGPEDKMEIVDLKQVVEIARADIAALLSLGNPPTR